MINYFRLLSENSELKLAKNSAKTQLQMCKYPAKTQILKLFRLLWVLKVKVVKQVG